MSADLDQVREGFEQAGRTAVLAGWAKRLAVAVGVVILALGAYTLNGGLELSGSPVAASQLAYTLGLTGEDTAADVGERVTVADGRQTVIVSAVTGADEPGNLQVAAGLPTTLIVRSDKARGCVRAFVIPSLGVEKVLPISGDTRIDLGVLKPGHLSYACSMGMYTGRLTVTETTP